MISTLIFAFLNQGQTQGQLVAADAAWPKYKLAAPVALPAGELYMESSVKGSLRQSGSSYIISLAGASGRRMDSQLFFRFPQSKIGSLGKLTQLTFSVRSSQPTEGNVEVTMGAEPWTRLGLDQPLVVTDKWKSYKFNFSFNESGEFSVDPNGANVFLPEFMFTSIRGEIEIAGITLRPLTLDLSELPAPAPAPQNDAEVFAWLEQLPITFQKLDLPRVLGAWSPNFYDDFSTATKAKAPRSEFEKYWAAQMAYKGKYSNGPFEVFIQSLVKAGDKIIARGYWSGSWRMGTWDNLQPGGLSFGNGFITTWTKKGTGWLLSSLINSGSYKELTDSQRESLQQKHNAIRKSLGGSQ